MLFHSARRRRLPDCTQDRTMISARTRRTHLWAVLGNQIMHVIRPRGSFIGRDGAYLRLASTGQKLQLPPERLFRNRDEAERYLALRILAG